MLTEFLATDLQQFARVVVAEAAGGTIAGAESMAL